MIRLSIGNSRMEKHWNLVEMELSEFRDRISHTRRTAETVEQYRKMSKAKQDEIKDVGGFVLGTLKGGRRKKDCVLTRSGLSLDMDYATEDIIDQIEMFFSFQCYVYSTHKHTPEKPRLRLIIPLVVSNNRANENSPVITVIPLTARTYKRPNFPTHVLIPKASGTGLARNSMALAEQVSTIDKSCLMEKKGAVTDMEIMEAVTRALQIQIGVFERYN